MPSAKFNPATAAGEGSEKKGMPGAIFLAECCAGSDPPVLAQRLEADPHAHLLPSSSKDHGKVALQQQSVRCEFEVLSRRRRGSGGGKRTPKSDRAVLGILSAAGFFLPLRFPSFFVCCLLHMPPRLSEKPKKREAQEQDGWQAERKKLGEASYEKLRFHVHRATLLPPQIKRLLLPQPACRTRLSTYLRRRPSLSLRRRSSRHRLFQPRTRLERADCLVLSTERVKVLDLVDPDLQARIESFVSQRSLGCKERREAGRTIQFSVVNASSSTSSVGEAGMSC